MQRWVWSPLEESPDQPGKLPTCRQYARSSGGGLAWFYPAVFGWFALVRCEMTHAQLEAAQQDPTIVVLDSLASPDPIPAALAAALADKGVLATDTPYRMMQKLAAIAPAFLPES